MTGRKNDPLGIVQVTKLSPYRPRVYTQTRKWERKIVKDFEIGAGRPDLVLVDKKQRTC